MKLVLALAAYVGAVVAANLMTTHLGLVSVGFGLLVTAGTFAAGFALLARDFIQRYGGYVPVFFAIGVGTVLSLFIADPHIAGASAIAFVGAELVDLLVFTPVRDRAGFVAGAISSNVVSAPVDTVLFLVLAGFPLTWEAVTGQFIGKVVLATLIPLALYVIGRRALLREPLVARHS